MNDIAINQPIEPSHKVRARNTREAEMLRPSEIYREYGICPSTLHGYCTDESSRRLPSFLLPSRPGSRSHRGVRLVRRSDLETWLKKWAC